MEYKASHRFARISPTKVRSIANLVRFKTVADAMEVLSMLPNRGARLLEQVIKSAAANADDLGARSPELLTVVDARVDEGPRLKRIMPRARGTAFGIISRMAHISVKLS